MSERTLIRGGTVLTLGARTANHAVADVLIEDGVVAEVGQGLRSRGAEVVEATDAIVMPGFVDTHRHVWNSLFRNLGESGANGAGPVRPDVYGPHYRPDDVYAATLIGLLGAVEAGITTVVDWSDVSGDPEHVDAALQAHRDAGLRTVFVHSRPQWDERHEEEKAGLRRLAAMSAQSPYGMPTVAFGPSEPLRQDLDRVSRERGRPESWG